jgi:hypothetical protein
MNNSLSLLDFGLYTLEQDINFIGAGDPYVNPYVIYDWDSNRIRIGVWYTGSKLKTRNEAKNWCSSIICEIRKLLGIDCSTVKSLIPTRNSLVIQYFSHKGYTLGTQPKNLGSEIDKIVEISIGVYWGKNKNSKHSKFLRCEVPLLGTEILCSD